MKNPQTKHNDDDDEWMDEAALKKKYIVQKKSMLTKAGCYIMAHDFFESIDDEDEDGFISPLLLHLRSLNKDLCRVNKWLEDADDLSLPLLLQLLVVELSQTLLSPRLLGDVDDSVSDEETSEDKCFAANNDWRLSLPLAASTVTSNSSRTVIGL